MARLPKLASQWKIIHDFKATEYLQTFQQPGSLCVRVEKPFRHGLVGLCFSFPKIVLAHSILRENNQPEKGVFLQSNQLPEVGEWTRIEISHEEVEGKYFLSLSVGGREVGREEVTDPQLRELTDAKVTIGHNDRELSQPGYIRRLVVLEKQNDVLGEL